MEQTHSAPVDWVGQEHLGFVINAAFSDENARMISDWLEGLRRQVPEGIHCMESEGLHITVMDWVAPLFDYAGADKRALYESLFDSYDTTFAHITGSMQPFTVNFNEIRVTPGTVILVGQDEGQFQSLRAQFMDSVRLPEGGKQPPNIIHSSLLRFVGSAIELAPVEAYAAANPLQLIQPVNVFRLVETRREPMQDFSVLKEYRLAA